MTDYRGQSNAECGSRETEASNKNDAVEFHGAGRRKTSEGSAAVAGLIE